MYKCRPSSAVEIESVSRLLSHAEEYGDLRDTVMQNLDLREPEVEALLLEMSMEDACFLGCDLSAELDRHVRSSGGVVFPAFTGIPFKPYRSSLYAVGELMEGYRKGEFASLHDTVDRQIYDYYTGCRDGKKVPVMDALAFRIHDHAIDDALSDLLHPDDGPSRRVVGIMGGHRLRRDDPSYRAVAELGWELARRGYLVATGGGPGAMEAANLGAYLSGNPASDVHEAVDTLAAAPQYDDPRYFDTAYDVLEQHPDGAESLAIPTWFYGHEPSNLFPSHVAKYFANSLREDGLLAIATHGVVYAPGSAGTIQEIFMDAAQNHYETFGPPSPMVFLDRTYWTETKPVYPLLESLAQDAPHEHLVAAYDEVGRVVEEIVQYERG